MSFEISTTWPKESQKTFSIIVRTYLYGNLERHSKYDFNLCGTQHCQVYRGYNLVDEGLFDSARSTNGLVLTDPEDKLAQVYYYSADGGCTVGIADVWGNTEFSYLKAVPTPWETYRMYGENGRTKWQIEYTPWELYQQVKGECPELTGPIAEVSTTLALDSTYVNSITFKDVNGNTSTINGVGDVRGLLGFKSANFIVGKAGETVRRTVYSLDCYDGIYSRELFALPTVGLEGGKAYAVTSNGSVEIKGGINVVTSKGESFFDRLFGKRVQVVTASEDNCWLTEDGLPDILRGEVIRDTEGVLLPGDNGNFVFDGYGWGHGIGISQHGIKNLVNDGYKAETILRYYFSGTQVKGINTLG